MSVRGFVEKFLKDQNESLVKIEWNPETDRYHITFHDQPTVTCAIAGLEDLKKAVDMMLGKAIE